MDRMHENHPMFLAYVAGIVDGEGSIGIYENTTTRRRGKSQFYMQVSITNTDKTLLDMIQRRWPSYLPDAPRKRPSPRHKTVWRWRVASRKALSFLRDIRPYLFMKADRADLAIKFQTEIMRQSCVGNRTGKCGGQPLSDEEHALRLTYSNAIKEANQRGRKSA